MNLCTYQKYNKNKTEKTKHDVIHNCRCNLYSMSEIASSMAAAVNIGDRFTYRFTYYVEAIRQILLMQRRFINKR